ncbi:spore-associated protein [Streptomyces sp. NPDC006367]|uniref:spore-associated protein n=1 Tax=unclassified Streptomyces TaxID=2593676 RepID=UPI0033AFD4B4
MMNSRSLAATAALAAVAVGGATALAAPASAAASVTPQTVCGSGYRTVNSAPIGSRGTVYLTYNAVNGRNCVVTIRNTTGTAVDMSAYIYVPDTEQRDGDYGRYRSYAGPVRAYGKGHCVDWGGSIGGVSVHVTGSNCAALKEERVTTTR